MRMIKKRNLRVLCILLILAIIIHYIYLLTIINFNHATELPSVATGRKIVKRKDLIPSPPGIIACVGGGIGNQLSMYACAHSLAKDKNLPLYVYPWGKTEGRRFSVKGREYALDHFNIPSHTFQLISRETFKKIPKNQLRHISDKDLLNRSDLIIPQSKFLVTQDMCQSKFYYQGYEDEIKSILKLSENSPYITKLKSDSRLKSTLEMIQETESVAVHVRRGDRRSSPKYFLPSSFHKHAVQRMVNLLKVRGKESPTFFVFSDDINYTKKVFSAFKELLFVYVTSFKTSSIQDLYLMRKCKHIIFPSSSFSWWAAYLLEDLEGIRITSTLNPLIHNLRKGKKREFYIKVFGTMYHPKDWIVINPYTGNFVQ